MYIESFSGSDSAFSTKKFILSTNFIFDICVIPISFDSVSKINILNTLIDQLVKIQNDTTKPKLPTDLTDSQVDAMIKDYQGKIKTAINTAKANPFALTAGNGLGKGLVVNTLV